jgi:hypothetical protein
VDTNDQIVAGLSGKAERVAVRSSADYFTDEPEEVELTSWVERKLRRGALILAPSSEPRHPLPNKTPAAPVPLSEEPK